MIDGTKPGRREATLPAATLADLLGAAGRQDVDGLRESGRSTGRLLAERLLSPQDGAPSARELPTSLFWKRISELFASRGWGSLALEAGAPGTAVLHSGDWIEAERSGGADSCAFTAGLIEGVLGEVSGASIEVREVDCRASGAPACRFVFGSHAAVEAAQHAAAAAAPA